MQSVTRLCRQETPQVHEHYEVEPRIMYDPNDNKCYVNLVDYDAVIFVGETYHSDVKFDTLDEAMAFSEYLMGVLSKAMIWLSLNVIFVSPLNGFVELLNVWEILEGCENRMVNWIGD